MIWKDLLSRRGLRQAHGPSSNSQSQRWKVWSLVLSDCNTDWRNTIANTQNTICHNNHYVYMQSILPVCNTVFSLTLTGNRLNNFCLTIVLAHQRATESTELWCIQILCSHRIQNFCYNQAKKKKIFFRYMWHIVYDASNKFFLLLLKTFWILIYLRRTYLWLNSAKINNAL